LQTLFCCIGIWRFSSKKKIANFTEGADFSLWSSAKSVVALH